MGAKEVEEYYDFLVSEEMHPSKRKGLAIVHQICRERFEMKATSWEVASIGRESGKRGGPNEGSLRQPKLRFYRELIEKWRQVSRSSYPHEKRKSSVSDDWIAGITDLTRRQLTYAMKRDLDRAKQEVRLLKKQLPNNGVQAYSEVLSPMNSASVSFNARSIFDPSPNQAISVRRFLKQFLDRPDVLRDKALLLKGDVLLDTDTGEVLAERQAVEAFRAMARLHSS